MKLTYEKEIGIKFEIWLELLLKNLGYKHISRNVQYHKSKKYFRQVDISYYFAKNNAVYFSIIEAKYSSSILKYKLSIPKIKKLNYNSITIDNLVDEIIERKNFVKADFAYLATNNYCEPLLIQEAKKNSIIIVDKEYLSKLNKKFSSKSLEESIKDINITKYNLNPNIIYI